MSRWTPLIATIAAVAFAGAAATAQVSLRPNHTAGTEAAFDLTTKSTQRSESTRITGGSATQQHEQSVRLRVKVLNVKDSGATMALTFERIKYELEPGMGAPTMRFDSDLPAAADANNPLAEGLRPVLNKPFIISVSPTGEITEVTVPSELENLIKSGVAAGTFVNEDMIKTSLASIVALPGTPGEITVGDTWSTVAVEPLHLRNSAIATSTMTLVSADDGRAVVDVSGGLRVEGPNGMKAIAVAVNESSSKGQIVFNLNDGFVVSSIMDETVEMEGDPEPDFRMKVRTVSHSEVNRVK